MDSQKLELERLSLTTAYQNNLIAALIEDLAKTRMALAEAREHLSPKPKPDLP